MTFLQQFKKELLEPISFDKFMARALFHYYSTRDPFNRSGDFITSPEISQMFGEMIAFFYIDYWKKLGCPTQIHLVEMGPGRGTLMSDFLRIAQKIPEFFQAISVHMVEMSATLRKIQKETLAQYGKEIHHHDSWYDLPSSGMLFVIANEFFDALPVQQFIYKNGSFFERYVAYHEKEDHISSVWSHVAINDLQNVGFDAWESRSLVQKIQEGDTVELCKPARFLAKDMAQCLKERGGIMLVIDYGYTILPIGDSVQAVKNHMPVSLFDDVGEADITAHVDFGALYRIFAAKAHAYPIMTQGDFLRGLGIEELAQKYAAQEGSTSGSLSAVERLTSSSEMGHLFKVFVATGSNEAPTLWDSIEGD